jgi:hypothetical protein
MQLCFVSVHGPRETYFVDVPRNILPLSQNREIGQASKSKETENLSPLRMSQIQNTEYKLSVAVHYSLMKKINGYRIE